VRIWASIIAARDSREYTDGDASGQFMTQIMIAVAEFEKAKIVERHGASTHRGDRMGYNARGRIIAPGYLGTARRGRNA
jgi:DNA invertase Pin-like site-specific DNA recombinase